MLLSIYRSVLKVCGVHTVQRCAFAMLRIHSPVIHEMAHATVSQATGVDHVICLAQLELLAYSVEVYLSSEIYTTTPQLYVICIFVRWLVTSCNSYYFRFTLLLSFGCLVISAYCHLASELLTLMNVHTLIILFTEVIFTNRAVSNLDVQRTVELTFL